MTTPYGLRAAIIVFLTSLACGARAQETGGDTAAGRALALKDCSGCHRVDAAHEQASRPTRPPAFADVANMPATTARSLYVFLHTSHPSMPNFILSDQETDDVIAYILSLRKDRRL